MTQQVTEFVIWWTANQDKIPQFWGKRPIHLYREAFIANRGLDRNWVRGPNKLTEDEMWYYLDEVMNATFKSLAHKQSEAWELASRAQRSLPIPS